ncbi:hypothetical protein RRG08_063713 [Elysia crispata]|uniref:Uncharacterized protein n=1 Tax=Elysia crispata TaxID=231223 RepID=A0AAE0ZV19_9GAST|nr:hypothetical protein RRG08_063713 [Elysia crispata]
MSEDGLTEDNVYQEIDLERKKSSICLADQVSETGLNIQSSEANVGLVKENNHPDDVQRLNSNTLNPSLDSKHPADQGSIQNISMVKDLQVQTSRNATCPDPEKDFLVRGTENCIKHLVNEHTLIEGNPDDHLINSENTNMSNDIQSEKDVDSSGLDQGIEEGHRENNNKCATNMVQATASSANNDANENHLCDQSNISVSYDSHSQNYDVDANDLNDGLLMEEAEDDNDAEKQNENSTSLLAQNDEAAQNAANLTVSGSSGSTPSGAVTSVPRGSPNRGHVRVAGRPQGPQRPPVMDAGLADDFVDGDDEELFFFAPIPAVAETAPDLTPGDLLSRASQSGIMGLWNPIDPVVLRESAPQEQSTPGTGAQSSTYASAEESPLTGVVSPPVLIEEHQIALDASDALHYLPRLNQNDIHHHGAENRETTATHPSIVSEDAVYPANFNTAQSITSSNIQPLRQSVGIDVVNENTPSFTGSSSTDNDESLLPLRITGFSIGSSPTAEVVNRQISLSNESPQNKSNVVNINNFSPRQNFDGHISGGEIMQSKEGYDDLLLTDGQKDSDGCLSIDDNWDSTDDGLEESFEKPTKEQTRDTYFADKWTEDESHDLVLASAENDFMSLEIKRNASSPVIDQRVRTEQDADDLLNQIISGRTERGMGPNAAFPVAECSKRSSSDISTCLIKPKLGGKKADEERTREDNKQNINNTGDSRHRKRKGGGYVSSSTAYESSYCESTELDNHDETSHGIPDIINHSTSLDTSQEMLTSSLGDSSLCGADASASAEYDVIGHNQARHDANYEEADIDYSFTANHNDEDLETENAEKSELPSCESDQFQPGDIVADTNSNLMKHSSVSVESGFQEDLTADEDIKMGKNKTTCKALHSECTLSKTLSGVSRVTNEINARESNSATSTPQEQPISNSYWMLSEEPGPNQGKANSLNEVSIIENTQELKNSSCLKKLETETVSDATMTQVNRERTRLDTIYEDVSGDTSSVNTNIASVKKNSFAGSGKMPDVPEELQYLSSSDQCCDIKQVVNYKHDETAWKCAVIHSQENIISRTDIENSPGKDEVDNARKENMISAEETCEANVSGEAIKNSSPAKTGDRASCKNQNTDEDISLAGGCSGSCSNKSILENDANIAADGFEVDGDTSSKMRMRNDNNLESLENLPIQNVTQLESLKLEPLKLETYSLKCRNDQTEVHKTVSPPKPVKGDKKKEETPNISKALEYPHNANSSEVKEKSREHQSSYESSVNPIIDKNHHIDDELPTAINLAVDNNFISATITETANNEFVYSQANRRQKGSNNYNEKKATLDEPYKTVRCDSLNLDRANTRAVDICNPENDPVDQDCFENVKEKSQNSASSCSHSFNARIPLEDPQSCPKTQKTSIDIETCPQLTRNSREALHQIAYLQDKDGYERDCVGKYGSPSFLDQLHKTETLSVEYDGTSSDRILDKAESCCATSSFDTCHEINTDQMGQYGEANNKNGIFDGLDCLTPENKTKSPQYVHIASGMSRRSALDTGMENVFPQEHDCTQKALSSHPEKSHEKANVSAPRIDSANIKSTHTPLDSALEKDPYQSCAAVKESISMEDTHNSNASRCPIENEAFPGVLKSNNYSQLEAAPSAQNCSAVSERDFKSEIAKNYRSSQETSPPCKDCEMQQSYDINYVELPTEDEQCRNSVYKSKKTVARVTTIEGDESGIGTESLTYENDKKPCLGLSDEEHLTISIKEGSFPIDGVSESDTSAPLSGQQAAIISEPNSQVVTCCSNQKDFPIDKEQNCADDKASKDYIHEKHSNIEGHLVRKTFQDIEKDDSSRGNKNQETITKLIVPGDLRTSITTPQGDSENCACKSDSSKDSREYLQDISTVDKDISALDSSSKTTEDANTRKILSKGSKSRKAKVVKDTAAKEFSGDNVEDQKCSKPYSKNAGQNGNDKDIAVERHSETNTSNISGDNSFSTYEDDHDFPEEQHRLTDDSTGKCNESCEDAQSPSSSVSISDSSRLEESKTVTRLSSSGSEDKQNSRSVSVRSQTKLEEKEMPCVADSSSSYTCTSASFKSKTKIIQETAAASLSCEANVSSKDEQNKKQLIDGKENFQETQKHISPEQLILEATDQWLEKISDFCKSPTFISDSHSDARIHKFTAECKSQILSISKLKLGASASMHGARDSEKSGENVPQSPQSTKAKGIVSGKPENVPTLEKHRPKLAFGNMARHKNVRPNTRMQLSYACGGDSDVSTRLSRRSHLPRSTCGAQEPSSSPHGTTPLVRGNARHTDAELTLVTQVTKTPVPPPNKGHGRGDVFNSRIAGDNDSTKENFLARDEEIDGNVLVQSHSGEAAQVISENLATKDATLRRSSTNRLRRRLRADTKFEGPDEDDSTPNDKCLSPSQPLPQSLQNLQKMQLKARYVHAQDLKNRREGLHMGKGTQGPSEQANFVWLLQKSAPHCGRCIRPKPPMKIGIPAPDILSLQAPQRIRTAASGKETASSTREKTNGPTLHKRYRPQRILTVKEFEKEQLARHLNLDFHRIHKTGPSVDCHMDPYVMRRTKASVERQRARTNQHSLLALENCKFLHILNDTKSVYHTITSQPTCTKSRDSTSYHGGQLGQHGHCVSSSTVNGARSGWGSGQRSTGEALVAQWASRIRPKTLTTKGLDSYIQTKVKVRAPQRPGLAR